MSDPSRPWSVGEIAGSHREHQWGIAPLLDPDLIVTIAGLREVGPM